MLLKVRNYYEKGTEWILNSIYPHRCPICHEILADQSALVCQDCFYSLEDIREPRCKNCGRPVKEEEELCGNCKGRTFAFTKGRGIFLYTAQMRHSVLLYKYGGRKEYGRFFAHAMAFYGRKELERWKPDLLLAIPLHKSKIRRRGFNQAEVLAEIIAAKYRIPFASDVLTKTVQTRSQKKLDANARRRNLKKAFHVNSSVKDKRILLIDDVFTTGSTIDAAAECLKEAGAREVYFLTLCIAVAE